MRTWATRILWLAVTGALLYGGFVAYERWWDGDLAFLKDRAFSLTRDTAENIKEKASEAAGDALDTAKEQAAEATKDFIASAVGDLIESVGETIQEYGRSLGNSVSSDAQRAPPVSGTGFIIPPPPVTLSTSVNETLAFAVNHVGRYTVNWGDGAFGEGMVTEGKPMLLNHAWISPGDYAVKLSVVSPVGTHTETFPVRVYE
jgi:hypothetical protein